jgi:hypothetical protein
MNDQDFKIWSREIYLAISDIADIEKQKHSWAGDLANVVSSHAEIINTLYDFDFDGFLKYISINNLKLFNQLNDFKLMIDNYDDSGLTDLEILNDVDWIHITQKAKDIITNWNY